MTRGWATILITLVLLLLSVTIGLASQIGKSLLCDKVIAFQSIRDGNYEIYLLLRSLNTVHKKPPLASWWFLGSPQTQG
jgi:hypothetical protein